MILWVMKFVDLIKQSEWEDIKNSLIAHYPETAESISGYCDVFNTLRQLTPQSTNFRICITEEFNEDFDDEPYTSVTGKDGSLNKELSGFKYRKIDPDSEYAKSEIDYSIAMADWSEWLGMSLDETVLLNYEIPDILSHCLWEMTFYGFNQETIKQHVDELQETVDEIKNMSEEEKKIRLIPWKDVVKDLEEDQNGIIDSFGDIGPYPQTGTAS